ncbi:MAG: hypothetical protein OI74_09385 [Gammaproteobacteria bacterium (ex Lamellibrachia satsuma)]|nr:MAG: hypothetical protein HPY30_16955 [Gammaproteobacteria bacterium (ex Lamellibrachia satsuma)]RRS32979.1 MAG: hypothetical protein OI74_09385 [Gammaproteobacteria bacterium (ex Lamellibrachia satsuma)]RRS36636.1 MAG: hypothetical protein NV67_06035 [Gammaproteobacteria bacterium (ex Lamellibrachia satsuma)]
MSTITECLSQVRLGEPQVHHNLVLFPLIAEKSAEPHYLLLDEALARGCARVTEVSESGSVPELRFVNECDRPVLLLDGEELVGAKQNRILNLTVMAPAHKSIIIPVSCVEAGRWQAESADFASAKRAHYAAGRASKAAHVSASLRNSGTRRSDQSAVWQDISEKSARMQAHSRSEAAAAMYQQHRASLDDFLQAFLPIQEQAGAMFAVNGRTVGLDLFDSPATLSSLLGKLVESYALDAIDTAQAGSEGAATDDPQVMLDDTAKAAVECFPSVGEGEDLRLHGERLSGGALVKENRVIHLCAFRLQVRGSAAAHGGSRFARASQRRSRWRH